MRGHARSFISIFIVLFFALFLTLFISPIPLGDQNGGVALADPGSGWENQDIPYTEGEITAISAVDGNTAWASIDEAPSLPPAFASVLKTENGGSDWFIQNLGTPGAGLSTFDVYAVDKYTAWALKWGVAYRTINGGLTWDEVSRFHFSPSGGVNARNICALDAYTALYTTYNYSAISGWPYICSWDIFRTSDGGADWTTCAPDYLTASPVFYEGVSSLDVAEDSTVWMYLLASPQMVFRSTDAGETWETHELTEYSIHDICALDSTTAWAVGSEGTTTPGSGTGVILMTSDGGVTWEVQRSENGLVLSSISAVDATTAWAAGGLNTSLVSADRGVILKTTDGGATWSTQYECLGGYLSSVCAVDADTAWAGGKSPSGSPLLLKTENGGNPIPLSVTSITPDQAIQHTIAMNITDLSGTGFMPGATVRLEKGTSVIEGYSVEVVSDTRITCLVGFFGTEPGAYDVVVTNLDGQEARLEEGFNVTPVCGSGSGAALLMLGLTLGLLSLAGTAGLKKRNIKK